jgi:bleomycin hydrolase
MKTIKQSQEMMDEVKKQMTNAIKKEFHQSTCPTGTPITADSLNAYSMDYNLNPVNRVRMNTLSSLPLSACCENRAYLQTVNYSYSHSLSRVPQATSQEHSGRCWLFAALNSMRYYLIRDLSLPDSFELSEAYLFFYDKFERANVYLENMVLRRGLPINDYKLQTLMNDPVQDGGTWNFVVNLINKYGIVPKTIYGESFNSSISEEMNQILSDKLAKFTYQIRNIKHVTDEEVRHLIVTDMLPQIYQLLATFMGEPPKPSDEFDWEYNEAGENVESIRHKGDYKILYNLTPMSYYTDLIKPHYNVSQMVLLRNDPRKTSKYGYVYTSELMDHMVGGQPDLAFNLSMKQIKSITAKTIIAGHPVWFACEVQRNFNPYYGLLAVEGYDYNSMLGLSVTQTKEEGVTTRNSSASHAMAIVGLNLVSPVGAEHPVVDKWKIENSWGEFNFGDPGYLQMTDAWFDRYGYEVVVPISIIPKDLLLKYDQRKETPFVLPFNDPLRSLSKRDFKASPSKRDFKASPSKRGRMYRLSARSRVASRV